MKRTILILTAIGMLLTAGVAFADGTKAAADVGMTADQIIDKYIEARGGRDAWEKVQTAKINGKMSMPSQGMEFPLQMEWKRPTMLRIEASIQGMTMVQAYDGETGWAIMPMLGKPDPEEMADDQLNQILDQADFEGPLVDYEEKGHSVELLGMGDVEGTEAFKLKITKKNGDEITTFIDTENFIELRQMATQDMQGVEVEMTTDFSDYKEVGGIILPHSFAVSMGGPAMQVISIDNIELDSEISNDRFAMPAKTEKPAEEGAE